MNNKIAEKLKGEVRGFFGSKVEPLGLFRACHDAITHFEDLSRIIYSLNIKIKYLDVSIGDSANKFSELEGELKDQRNKNKSLQNKLNVANHKCSAYKSILKDAIKCK